MQKNNTTEKETTNETEIEISTESIVKLLKRFIKSIYKKEKVYFSSFHKMLHGKEYEMLIVMILFPIIHNPEAIEGNLWKDFCRDCWKHYKEQILEYVVRVYEQQRATPCICRHEISFLHVHAAFWKMGNFGEISRQEMTDYLVTNFNLEKQNELIGRILEEIDEHEARVIIGNINRTVAEISPDLLTNTK